MGHKQEQFELSYTNSLIVGGTDNELLLGTVLCYRSGASEIPQPEAQRQVWPHQRAVLVVGSSHQSAVLVVGSSPVSILANVQGLPRRYNNPTGCKCWPGSIYSKRGRGRLQ